MAEYERSVFISYAWGGAGEDIVNAIDEALQKRGIRIVRDKRALEYKGSIKSFMERIGRGDCVIVVISDKYLRSPNCMFELVEIASNKRFERRIFPVVLADADIYKPAKQVQYIKHWESEIKELNDSLEGVGRANLQGIYEQLDLYDRIRDNISRLTAILSDMNTLTPNMHRDSDFSNLYDAIVERLEKADQVTRKARTDPKRLAQQNAEETDHLTARKIEERGTQQKAEEEHLAQPKAEAERLAQQKAEEEKLAVARAEIERKAKEDRETKAETDRLAAQKVEVDPKVKNNLSANNVRPSFRPNSKLIKNSLLLAGLWALTIAGANLISRVFGLANVLANGSMVSQIVLATIVFCVMSLGYALSLIFVLNMGKVSLTARQKVILTSLWILISVPIDILGRLLYNNFNIIAGWRIGYIIYGLVVGLILSLLLNKNGYKTSSGILSIGFAIAFLLGDYLFQWMATLLGTDFFSLIHVVNFLPDGFVVGLICGWLLLSQLDRGKTSFQ